MNEPSAALEQLPPEIAEMLPEEILQAMEQEKAKRLEQIEAIGQAIAKKRDEAVKGRSASGIEQEWAEDEEAYLGIDDANRGEGVAYKPTSHSGSAIIPRKGKGDGRSTVFLNITRPYTDAASARVADMLLPTDDKNWSIKPTPVPEIDSFLKKQTQQSAGALAPAPVPPAGGAVPPGMSGPPQPPQQQDQIAMYVQEAMEIMATARKQAEGAETQIEDWLVQCNWHAEMRKVIEDCSRIGTGIMKGPTPIKRKKMKTKEEGGAMSLSVEMKTDPASKRIDPWKFYPDPNCGESIHNGQYVFEVDDLTVRQLRDLRGTPGYLDEMIDKIIEEGPGKKNLDTTRRIGKERTNDDDLYQVWYFYGHIDRDDLELMNVDVDCCKKDAIPAIVTLVNDSAIKAHLNPLDSGEFPYDVMPWQRRQGSWAGVGVSRQVRTPQKMINAGTRNMMDNAGLSGGPQIIIRRNAIEPVDGSWAMTPRKFWYAKEDADVRNVGDAIMAINIPNMQNELMNIINFALKMAEDVTGLPQIMQGQTGDAPDTVGGMTMLQNNASTVLRRIARTFDDCITEPHIRRYYEYLMMYGDDKYKGDFQIDARGSTALVERDLQNQAIMQMSNLVLNPAFGLSPSKWIVEAIKAQRLDPKKFEMTEEEKAQVAQQQQPEAPQVAAAKIRAEVDLKKKEMEITADQGMSQQDAEIEKFKIQRDIDRDTVYVNAERERTISEHDGRMSELQMKLQLAQLDYAAKHQMTLEQVKASLAETAMKLRAQKELAMGSQLVDLHKHATPQVITPAVEPPGRAKPGEAFQH